MRDWTGNKNSIYKALGASNHTVNEREINDFYATEPKAIDVLLSVEEFDGPIWEPACGRGDMSERLKEYGYNVLSTDLIDRGYGIPNIDFLHADIIDDSYDIITNPPYKYAQEFIEKAISTTKDGAKIAMFLKLQFLEGKRRKKLFEQYPPKVVYVSSSRLLCAKNAEFEQMRKSGGSAVAYAWFVWVKGYNGETVLKWVN